MSFDDGAREAVLGRFAERWQTLNDGAPYSDMWAAHHPDLFLLDEMRKTPPEDVEVIVDLLRRPPDSWEDFDGVHFAQCLIA